MSIYIISILSLIILVLIILLYKSKSDINDIYNMIEIFKKDDNENIFVSKKGKIADICYSLNKIREDNSEKLKKQLRLEQANKEILTSLSHDVRTPLASLLGYLDALENNIVYGNEKEEYIKIARKKAYNLKGLVDTLFDWFKIDSNEMEINLEKSDICELTKEIIIEYLPYLESKNIRLQIEIPEDEYFALIDNSAYRRVLSNLIQNVIVHSKCNTLKISALKQDKHVEVHVRDNGCGISKKDLPHIFERLYKADTARSHPNSGLGLCIAQELINIQNGELTVKSNVNEFTEFCIKFKMEN